MVEFSIEEAKKSLGINKFKLDEVCIEQPELFSTVASMHSQAVNLRDAAREALTIGDAEISNSLRIAAEKLTGSKLTEAKLSQQVSIHEEHKKLFDEYLKLKLEADHWSALRESFLQRSSMIKLLCELCLTDYWDTKSVKSNKSEDQVVTGTVRKRQTLHRRGGKG